MKKKKKLVKLNPIKERVTKVFRINLYEKEKQIFITKKLMTLDMVSYYVNQMINYGILYPHIDVKIIVKRKNLVDYTNEQFAELWKTAPANIRLLFKG